jgi:aspartate racemase
MSNTLVGVLGGLGPAAGFYFCSRLTELTKATRDQEHLQIVVWSDPTVPDRTDALLHDGVSVIPKLRKGIEFLKESGSTFLVVPCNTAHVWVQDIAREVGLDLLDIVDTNVSELSSHLPRGSSVALMGTEATIRSGIYQESLAESGLRALEPTSVQQADIMSAIYAVKSGGEMSASDAGAIIQQVGDKLEADGAQAIVVGCTELTLLLQYCSFSVPVIDSLEVLAKHTIIRARIGW